MSSAFDPSRFGWKRLISGVSQAVVSDSTSGFYKFWTVTRGAASLFTSGGGAAAPVNTAAPTITGSTVQGQTLTASTGTWTGSPAPTYTYQWQLCNSFGASCNNISLATSSTYVTQVGDIGSTIVVTVIATNASGAVTAASTATAAVTSPPAGGGGTPASSVTQNGVTFTFDKTYPTGQFVNGDWWVLPNAGDTGVTVTSITPNVVNFGQKATTTGVAGQLNGWMANPSGQAHCYDGQQTSTLASFKGTLQLALPYLAAPGTSIVKAVSLGAGVTAGSGANLTYLDKAVVLTALSTAPAADAFRPPYFGTYKPIFTQSQLITGSLPSLAAPAGSSGPSLAQVETRFQQVQLDHCYNTAVSGRTNPQQSFHAFGSTTTPHVYGENISLDNSEAILRVCLNESVATKQNAINYLVQAGIDWYGIAKGGTKVADAGGGGHNGGRKILVAFAGWLLNDTDVKAVAGETTGAGFGESQQFYWTAGAGGASSHFVGQGAGMALFGLINSFGQQFPYTHISGAKDIRDSQSLVDGGLNVAGAKGGTPVVYTSITSAAYDSSLYIGIALSHAMLVSTVCQVLPLRSIFNSDNEIFVADRMRDFGVWTQPGVGSGRATGWTTFVDALHGTLSNYGVIAAGYGSTFGNAMDATYRTTSTFTGP